MPTSEWYEVMRADMEANPRHPAHGTAKGYAYGCRCCKCRVAARDYRERLGRESQMRALAELDENPDDPRHGTTTGYRYGCRCDRCKAARHAWYVGWRRERRQS